MRPKKCLAATVGLIAENAVTRHGCGRLHLFAHYGNTE
jgi:hypothetical protein